MSANPMNDYRATMTEARLSPEQRSRLENAVAQARVQEEAAHAVRPAPRMVTRRTFAIGAAAAFVGIAGLGALNVFGGSTKSAANSFGLKAYALDDPSRPSGYTETLTKNVLTSNVGGYFGAWEDENGTVTEGILGYAFRFDLECIGENVASYSYHIKGDRAYFGVAGLNGAVPEELFPNGSFHMKKYECADSLFVTKETQDEFGPDKTYIPLIVLALPMDGEFQAAYDAARNVEHSDVENELVVETSSEFDRFVELNASQRISECLLEVTATYEDGISETKTYAIAPVDNFEELYLAFQEQRDECLLEELSGDSQTLAYPEDPELYTITQVA